MSSFTSFQVGIFRFDPTAYSAGEEQKIRISDSTGYGFTVSFDDLPDLEHGLAKIKRAMAAGEI